MASIKHYTAESLEDEDQRVHNTVGIVVTQIARFVTFELLIFILCINLITIFCRAIDWAVCTRAARHSWQLPQSFCVQC